MKCPKCGTEDCLSENPNVRIEGPGIIKTNSASILKTCNARRQLKILRENFPRVFWKKKKVLKHLR